MVTWISIELIHHTDSMARHTSFWSERGDNERKGAATVKVSNYAVKVYGNHLDMEDKFC